MSNESEFAWYKKITKVLSTVGYYAGSYAYGRKVPLGTKTNLSSKYIPKELT